jgi:hypothetical protein
MGKKGGLGLMTLHGVTGEAGFCIKGCEHAIDFRA